MREIIRDSPHDAVLLVEDDGPSRISVNVTPGDRTFAALDIDFLIDDPVRELDIWIGGGAARLLIHPSHDPLTRPALTPWRRGLTELMTAVIEGRVAVVRPRGLFRSKRLVIRLSTGEETDYCIGPDDSPEFPVGPIPSYPPKQPEGDSTGGA